MKKYTDFAIEKTCGLLNIGSPTGYTEDAIAWLENEFKALDVKTWKSVKGGLIADFGGRDVNNALFLEAHCDTLGGMVAEIKANGRLRIVNIGGMNANNAETENAVIVTRKNQRYEGTLQLIDASLHVNGEYNDTKRGWDKMELVLDEDVSSADDVRALGIGVGDYVCFSILGGAVDNPEEFGITSDEELAEYYESMNMNAIYALQSYLGIWE